MPHTPVADAKERKRALDVTCSFIVQAPAGSGKTELITQRYLSLLARVKQPEEILAITFTRKAVGEMKERIISHLHLAAKGIPPAEQHKLDTYHLACQALQNSQRQGWQLLDHPARLSIQTIDSLCASLGRQIPYFSRLGGQPEITSSPRLLYQKAARKTLTEYHDPSVQCLHIYLSHQYGLAEELLLGMLATREQWLPQIIGCQQHGRFVLERALQGLVQKALDTLQKHISEDEVRELRILGAYASSYLPNNSLPGQIDWDAFPEFTVNHQKCWQGLRELLLTQEGGWRKQITVHQGFPPKSKGGNPEYKTRMLNLLANLSERKDEELLRRSLQLVATVPVKYSDNHWDIIEAIIDVLLKAVANLWITFQSHGCVDYSQMSLSALEALGEEDTPTDLALALDNRISHVLIDEFQDTSISQYLLLRRLTSGWQEGDGRTFFAVGDPMQSIYRFRQAEVGLFLRARQNGIGNLHLNPLRLQVNFRSQASVVKWINSLLSKIFPLTEDTLSGAITYAPSKAFHRTVNDNCVRVNLSQDSDEETQKIINEIIRLQQDDPSGTIAILARNRNHLVDIIRSLKRNDIPFSALEMESLALSPVILDLITITRALTHEGDSIAWLSLLRAPWSGLCLADLQLLRHKENTTLWQALHDNQTLSLLSPDGQARVQRLLLVLKEAELQRGRLPLSRWVEGMWRQLGGPAFCKHSGELDDAATFFTLLTQIETEDFISVQRIEELVHEHYCAVDPEADKSLQLMTIHKAKGLEFDHVLIPGLARQPRSSSAPLLTWLELTQLETPSILLAMKKRGRSQTETPLFDYLWDIEKQCIENESRRLLYVACTRTRKSLGLFATLGVDRNSSSLNAQWKKPPTSSLMNFLWPHIKSTVPLPSNKEAPEATENRIDSPPKLQRVPASWVVPVVAACPLLLPSSAVSDSLSHEPPLYEWAGETARQTGILFHEWIRRLGEQDLLTSINFVNQLTHLQERIYWSTYHHGVASEHRNSIVERVIKGIMNMIEDPDGHWILRSDHHDSHWELALSGSIGDKEPRHIVIDRTFVDETDTRWVIDYKTGYHEGSGLTEFINSEIERYRPQLQLYANAFASLENRLIKKALYFPFHKKMIEVT